MSALRNASRACCRVWRPRKCICRAHARPEANLLASCSCSPTPAINKLAPGNFAAILSNATNRSKIPFRSEIFARKRITELSERSGRPSDGQKKSLSIPCGKMYVNLPRGSEFTRRSRAASVVSRSAVALFCWRCAAARFTRRRIEETPDLELEIASGFAGQSATYGPSTTGTLRGQSARVMPV